MSKKNKNKDKQIKNKSTDKQESKSFSKYLVPSFAIVLIFFSGYYLMSHSSSDNVQFKNAGGEGKVKVVEFMKFDCGHCYNMEKYLPDLLKKYGDKIDFTSIPMAWGQPNKPAPTASIEAYIIAEEMGKGKEMKDALFNAAFVQRKDINSIETLETAAKSIGLGGDFNSKLESGYARQKALYNIDLSQKYSVDQTPTFLINDDIKITPSDSGGDIAKMAQNIDAKIESLL